MPFLTRWLGASVLLATALGCSADAEEEEGGPPLDLTLDLQSTTLENGLEVVTVPNATAPVVTALIGVRAGSAVEPRELNGYSHLFEHMMFQGSTAVPDPLEFRAQLTEQGAAYNAVTQIDLVAYFFTVPASTLDSTLGLFAGALRTPAFDPVVLEKEKSVVLGEFDLNESDPGFLAVRQGLSLLYGEDAVRVNPLGSRDTVRAVTAAQLQAMHDRYYVPNNSLLVFSGAVTHEQGLELARSHFGDWARAADPKQEQPAVTPQLVDTPQFKVMPAKVTFTTIQLWWPGPSYADDPQGALAQGLFTRITEQANHSLNALISDSIFFAQLGAFTTAHTGATVLTLQVAPGQEAAALAKVPAAVKVLGEPGNFTSFQLAAAQDEVFSQQLFGETTPGAVPQNLADAWGNGGWQGYIDWTSDAYDVDQAAITRFARSYLRGRPRVTVLTSGADNLTSQGIDDAWLEKAVQ